MSNHGLAVMRLQPLHRGHIEMIKAMSTECEHVTIAIGSCQEMQRTKRNPFKVHEREEMIFNAVGKLIPNLYVFPVADINNNEYWARHVLHVCEMFHHKYRDVPGLTHYYAGSETDVSWFQYGQTQLKNVVINRNMIEPYCSASMIRDMMFNDDDRWKNFVPGVNHEIVKKHVDRLQLQKKGRVGYLED